MDECDNASAANVIRQVVRGGQPRINLRSVGISVTHYDEVWEISNPKNVVLQATPQDIAAGFVKFRGDNFNLQEWAGLIMAASSFLDLRLLDVHPAGEALLNALWDAAFTGACSESIFLLANRLIAS
jgi:hypothetical protein